jgi:hypothetical protein
MEPPLAPPLEAFFHSRHRDHDAERSVLSRSRLLGRGADENLLVHAYHMPFPGLGRVERHGSAFRWIPAT